MPRAAPRAKLRRVLRGDSSRISESMRESGEALAQSLAAIKGSEWLDLGCGDGTTALPAVSRGAEVLGVDIAGNLVVASNACVAAQGPTTCKFQEGDASTLRDIDDQAFGLVVSIFGAISPRGYL